MSREERVNRLPADSTHGVASTRVDSDAIRQRMRRLRVELNSEVEAAKTEASQMLDWKSYVAAHPWLCVGAAAAAGYFLAPKTERVLRLSDNQLKRLAKMGGVKVTAQSTGGESSSLFATATAAIGAIAGRAALSYVSRMIANQGLNHTGGEAAPSSEA